MRRLPNKSCPTAATLRRGNLGRRRRGGVRLRAFGVAIVKRTGEPASRGRVLWRNFLASAPFVIATGALRGQDRWIAGLPLCLAVALAVCSAFMRGRTLQDRLAGTDVVPR